MQKPKKPIIISTGVASHNDIMLALKECLNSNNKKIILLNCISSYPAQINELNLNHINKLKKQYCPIVGYSDHSLGKIASISSVAMGAKVIEKRFILNKKIKSADEKFSIFSDDFFDFVKNIRTTEKMLGKIEVDKKNFEK